MKQVHSDFARMDYVGNLIIAPSAIAWQPVVGELLLCVDPEESVETGVIARVVSIDERGAVMAKPDWEHRLETNGRIESKVTVMSEATSYASRYDASKVGVL